jgi:hypothetical protein
MPNVTQPPDSSTDRPLRPPNVTPEWVAELEFWAAERGLPPEPWPLP